MLRRQQAGQQPPRHPDEPAQLDALDSLPPLGPCAPRRRARRGIEQRQMAHPLRRLPHDLHAPHSRPWTAPRAQTAPAPPASTRRCHGGDGIILRQVGDPAAAQRRPSRVTASRQSRSSHNSPGSSTRSIVICSLSAQSCPDATSSACASWQAQRGRSRGFSDQPVDKPHGLGYRAAHGDWLCWSARGFLASALPSKHIDQASKGRLTFASSRSR